jgi:hypothetical protein
LYFILEPGTAKIPVYQQKKESDADVPIFGHLAFIFEHFYI